MPNWTVITVTYNSRDDLSRYWADQADRDQFDWIVVDNGSTDGTVQVAETLADRLIRSPGNIGFGAGNNLGLKAATTPFVAFVNPDIHITSPGWCENLAASADRYGGLVAPQLLSADGSLQANARGVPHLLSKVAHRLAPKSSVSHAYARTGFTGAAYCCWVMGAALAGRTKHFEDLDGWDERYFLYYEDHDIGLRAWRAGLPLVLEPSVEWVHDWKRETKSLNARAWRFELDSMRQFYSTYPALLTVPWGASSARLALRRLGLGQLAEDLWMPARNVARG